MIPFSSTTADTWGIDGTAFLSGYALLATAVLGATVLVRTVLRAAPARRPDPWLAGDDPRTGHLAAYLSGGPELAVLAALSSLRVAGTVAVASTRCCFRTNVTTTEEFSGLDRTILDEIASPVRRAALVRRPAVASACDELRSELIDRGLLLSDGRRRALRLVVLPLIAVLLLGVLRIVAGLRGGKSVGYLVILVGVVVVAVYLLLTRVPRRSWHAARNRERLRRHHSALAPKMRPDWTAHGPTAAALAVGVFGAQALWTADPVFAQKLALAGVATSGGGSSFGGISPWSGSSCGGGISSGGGGSSCGGGGGCGGGGCGG